MKDWRAFILKQVLRAGKQVLPPSGNFYFASLIGDEQWASGQLTVSFPTQGNFYGANEPDTGVSPTNADQQATMRAALAD